MEWVETTGKTVEEAVDAALDQLGVAEDDAEIEVIEEPKPGLFGRMRGEARIRARVRPTQPRPKEDRRDRRRRGRANGTAAGAPGGAEGDEGTASGQTELEQMGASRSRGRTREVLENGGSMEEPVALEDQAAEAVGFLNGLVERMALSAQVTSEVLDEENVEVRVDGEDLGILIGPRGSTLVAVQELTRTVVQRRLNAHNGRLTVDVSGYRQKRKVALERFTRQVAEQVLGSGERRILEPMSAPDRKVVHDTVNEIAGVVTVSEGEEPRRRVVILPEA